MADFKFRALCKDDPVLHDMYMDYYHLHFDRVLSTVKPHNVMEFEMDLIVNSTMDYKEYLRRVDDIYQHYSNLFNFRPIWDSNKGDYIYEQRILFELYFNECYRLFDSERKRRRLLRDKINVMMSRGDCYFVTLTFDDICLAKTKQSTRRQNVSRFLNSNCFDYVANIDFGADKLFTQREHYHAVVLCEDPNFVDKWKYIHNREKVYGNTDNSLGLYVNKLVAHGFKDSTCTGIYHLIYKK